MALMMGAMMIQGIQPGSAVMTSRPDLFWGLVASMWIGNLMLVIINLPMIGIWVKLLSLPYRFLYPAILLFCVIGVYSTNNNSVLMVFTAGFALFGYILVRLGCEPAPMILGFILGPLMEENLRRSLVLSRGDPMIFVQRPISAILLVLSACVVALIVLPALRKTREEAFQESDFNIASLSGGASPALRRCADPKHVFNGRRNTGRANGHLARCCCSLRVCPATLAQAQQYPQDISASSARSRPGAVPTFWCGISPTRCGHHRSQRHCRKPFWAGGTSPSNTCGRSPTATPYSCMVRAARPQA